MPEVTEQDILQRAVQALGEARECCQMLGRNADPEYINLRGSWYGKLKKCLEMLEGSARQMAHYRSDARWVRFGVHFARIMRGAQQKYGGHQWKWFTQLIQVLEIDRRTLEELSEKRTGVASSTPILPQRASEWLVLPDYTPAPMGRVTVH